MRETSSTSNLILVNVRDVAIELCEKFNFLYPLYRPNATEKLGLLLSFSFTGGLYRTRSLQFTAYSLR